jgi:hypothetical protein
MKTPKSQLTLQLKPTRRAKSLRLSLTGTLSDERTIESRRRLLALLGLWSTPEPLHVVLSAGASGGWQWAEEWTDALAVVENELAVPFVVRRGR